MEKKGQLEISFGMIFSTILVVIFLAAGFYAIQKFLDLQSDIQLKKLTEDLQKDVDSMWKSTQGSKSVEYVTPRKLTSVCFVNDPEKNTELIFKRGRELKNINHIDLENTLVGRERSICAEPVDGKLTLVLEKKYGEPLVTIKI